MQALPDFRPMYIFVEPSEGERVVVLFSIIAVVVAMVRVARLWIIAPPFQLKRQSENQTYCRLLERWRESTKQWMGFGILSWACVFSYEVGRFGMYAGESRRVGVAVVLSTIQRLGVFTEIAGAGLVLLFLAQWHMLNRVHALEALGNVHKDKPVISTTS